MRTHVVAVLLDIVCDPPEDKSEHVNAALEDVPSDDLRAFVRDVLAENPTLRERFLARFGEENESVDDYRAKIETLFERRIQNDPVVTAAIDFSHFFDLGEQYRDREKYLVAATVYRALFETVNENTDRIDAAYDHYAKTLQSALDRYVECVLAADPDQDEFETYIGVLEDQATSEPPANTEQFYRAIDDLEERR